MTVRLTVKHLPRFREYPSIFIISCCRNSYNSFLSFFSLDLDAYVLTHVYVMLFVCFAHCVDPTCWPLSPDGRLTVAPQKHRDNQTRLSVPWLENE